MAQYCRYCTELVYGDVAHCEVKGVLNEKYCKRTNQCKDFDLNPIDAFGENIKGYVPKKRGKKEYEKIHLDWSEDE